MDETNSRLPYLLDTLGRDQLQRILERCSEIIPFSLVIINTEGKPLAGSSSSDTCDIESLRFHVDREHHVVTEVVENPKSPFRTTLSAPVSVQDEVIGYVVLCEGGTPDIEDKYGCRIELVAAFIGDKA
jgi:hypothetical protein